MAYDESGRAARCRVVTALLAVALIVLVGANLCIGSVLVPADHIPGILSGGAANSMESQVIWEIRLPRVLSAVLLGGALSLSGFLLQPPQPLPLSWSPAGADTSCPLTVCPP